jgi:hypothetical protein
MIEFLAPGTTFVVFESSLLLEGVDTFVRMAITGSGTVSRNAQLGINDLYTFSRFLLND